MSDVFLEQMIKQKPTFTDLVKKFAVGTAGAILFLIAVFFLINSGATLGPIALLVAVGSIYLSIRVITAMNFEYEYIYTNGEIDVDRIAGKRKRKRITTVKIQSFDVFEKYDREKYANEKFDVRINACVSVFEPDTYCAVYNGKENKRCLLLFTPNERLLDAINAVSRRRRV